jgi:hypothetical protein
MIKAAAVVENGIAVAVQKLGMQHGALVVRRPEMRAHALAPFKI